MHCIFQLLLIYAERNTSAFEKNSKPAGLRISSKSDDLNNIEETGSLVYSEKGSAVGLTFVMHLRPNLFRTILVSQASDNLC